MATDPVARVEERVRKGVDRGLNRVFRNVREKYNRPIFSEKVPEDVQFNEFMLMKDDPQIMAQFLADQGVSQKDPSSALEYFHRMLKRMEQDAP